MKKWTENQLRAKLTDYFSLILRADEASSFDEEQKYYKKAEKLVQQFLKQIGA